MHTSHPCTHAPVTASAPAAKTPAEGQPSGPGCLPSHYWTWRRAPGEEYRIRYTTLGEAGPHLILLHGFGANSVSEGASTRAARRLSTSIHTSLNARAD